MSALQEKLDALIRDAGEIKQALTAANRSAEDAPLALSDNLDPFSDAEGKIMRRFHGPFINRRKFRIVEVDTATKERTYHVFADREEAVRARDEMRREAARTGGASVRQALALYREYLEAKGNKPGSITTTFYRLEALLGGLLAHPVAALNRADVENAVKAIAKQAGDSRLNIAAEGRTFLRWCHKNHHHRQDLSVHLKVVASRRHGEDSKPQLTKDEARKWLRVAEAKAAGGEVGALAAMLTLVLGMRVSEIVNRTVRDLDDGGNELVIKRAKTRRGNRRLLVPETLRPHLLRLAEGRAADEKLFEGLTRHHVNEHVQRLCGLAQVPVVCAHAMRGLHASLAVAAGATGTVVAASLGHESFRITAQSYATPDAVPPPDLVPFD